MGCGVPLLHPLEISSEKSGLGARCRSWESNSHWGRQRYTGAGSLVRPHRLAGAGEAGRRLQKGANPPPIHIARAKAPVGEAPVADRGGSRDRPGGAG